MTPNNERLELSVSVLATADIDDDEALNVARDALRIALNHLTARLPCKRFVSGICIGEGLVKRHRVKRRYQGESRIDARERRRRQVDPDPDPKAKVN